MTTMIQNVSLVKEQSVPAVYLVCGGFKIHIPSATEFEALGLDWAKIQVVPDGALAPLPQTPYGPASPVKPSDVFFDCSGRFSNNWGYEDTYDAIDGRWYWNCRAGPSIVRKNVLVAGWLKEDPFINGDVHGVEDVIFDQFILDPDFIDRMYGPNGLSGALNNALLQGNPQPGTMQLPVLDLSPVDGSRRVTINSFLLPNNNGQLHVETNAWHVQNTPPGPLPSFTRHFRGRGTAPMLWTVIPMTYSYEEGNPPQTVTKTDHDIWWAYNPLAPIAEPLRQGDYVLMRGTLWQDGAHGDAEPGTVDDPWDQGYTKNHAGWLELHPVDYIVKLNAPLPGQRRTAFKSARIYPPPGFADETLHIFPAFDKFYPAFACSTLDAKKAQVHKVQRIDELIDGRFTDMATVPTYQVENNRDHVKVSIGVTPVLPTTPIARFKGTFVVTWEIPGPAVCSAYPEQDRIDLFTRGTDDALYYRTFDGQTFSGWQSFGGVLTSDPAVAVFGAGLMYIFVRGTDNALWYLWRDVNASQPSGWQSQGGSLTSRPAVCSSSAGKLDLFVRGTDNAIWYKYLDVNAGGNWSDWQSLGGFKTSAPAATAAGEASWVFARGADNALYWMWIRSPTDHSGWQRLDGVWTSAPAVCTPDPDNQIVDIFARGMDNALWHNRFNSGVPGQWHSLGGVAVSDPAAMAMRSASWVFARGADNTLWQRWINLSGNGAGWHNPFGLTP